MVPGVGFGNTATTAKQGAWRLVVTPDVSLKAARLARDEAKKVKDTGADPVQARKMDKLKASASDCVTFEATAREWYTKQAPEWSESHASRAMRQFERDLFPFLGARPLAEIKPVELQATLRKIDDRGAIETADRALMLARQVWRYGVSTGRADRDITQDLKGALTPYRGKQFAVTTNPSELGELLRAMHGYKCGPIVRVTDALIAEIVALLSGIDCESATHPIAPLPTPLGALLRLAHKSAQRCRAFPWRPATAHSGASNCRIQDNGGPLCRWGNGFGQCKDAQRDSLTASTNRG